ncbi:M6 family metalloprotease domain-containing protein [Fibrobacter succinogenes]|uniref:M6 family metalloprotease domain-containing protein n=1 Tax=Fibrobacter succinogenes TaxID=833 RepID=A0A380S5F2_FIBSU|nr:M6 family metalloprotease domain-containing protein [Fibrobacter succinogenes]PWJ35548.1 M6 family metalloprotease-like protein [Fibrobacter succinogenes subsp. elongatus]SUQ24203.1 M6 family metalloprotease domain-containing protein [Fibrobacter succinogenes]
MKTKIAFGLLMGLLLLPTMLFADIVYQGKRVQEWPEEARPSFNNQSAGKPSFLLARTPVTQNKSHYAAPKGKIYSLTLLVDFSDQKAPVSVADVEEWLNKEGFNRDGCNGSVRDYYLDVSNGQLDLTNEVFGWYRAKHPKSWYESLPGYTGSDSLMKEVFAYFDPMVDFSRYDNDKNGTTEAINIVYAGPGQTWGQGLWPHSGWSNERRDGVRLTHHQMTDMPGKFSIYVFVHESGHMIFGWPDLYWYGDYCTMGNRAHDLNPVAINDFYRADQGWIPFVDVTSNDVSLETTKPGEVCYRYKNPARPDKEGLVWSYVQNKGRNQVLKGSGLLMQHYDFSIEGNTASNKLGLKIVRANHTEPSLNGDKDQWPNPGSTADAFFKSGTYPEFSDETYPAITWYSGAKTGLKITDIGTPGETLTFCIGGNCPEPESSSSTGVVSSSSSVPVVSSSSSAPKPESSSSAIEIKIEKIAFEVTLPIDNNYAYVTLDLKGDDVAKILGIKKSEIADKVKFYGIEPDGTLNSSTTGEGTGHWFDKDGKIVAWDPNGTSIVYSNVDLTTMTTKIGHMPNKVKSGDSFVVRQAVVYESKQVTFEITVTIPQKTTRISSIRSSKRGKPGNMIFNALGKPVGKRTESGELPDLPKGAYVEIAK